jgi:isocitrate dehydrogenase
MKKIDIAIARGDGIGPEIMKATLLILEAAGANLNTHEVEVGEKVYLKGYLSGIEPKSWDIIREAQAFLKAPVTTPQGGGFRSLNVTIRGVLGLYADVRPCVAYYPFVDTKHPNMDVTIVRENEEDLYTGIEYRQTEESYHALKIITKKGCEKIIRYAFEYALRNERKKVTCFTKDNILKMSDGTFHKIFNEISKEYPQITPEHWIVDIGAAKLADSPENFDVIVLPNLYGDILSDVAAQIAGSVGLAGSANIGDHAAMFEAIHGSAPRRAGQNLANPSGLLLAAVMMLEHLGEMKTAELIHNAWLTTLEEGIHTYDIFDEQKSRLKVGTQEFAQAVIERLGKVPEKLKPAQIAIQHREQKKVQISDSKPILKRLVGADFFIGSKNNPIQEVKKAATGAALSFSMMANRGLTVFPNGPTDADLQNSHFSDEWRCRFQAEKATHADIIDLQQRLVAAHLDVTKHENLYFFDDEPGFSI